MRRTLKKAKLNLRSSSVSRGRRISLPGATPSRSAVKGESFGPSFSKGDPYARRCLMVFRWGNNSLDVLPCLCHIVAHRCQQVPTTVSKCGQTRKHAFLHLLPSARACIKIVDDFFGDEVDLARAPHANTVAPAHPVCSISLASIHSTLHASRRLCIPTVRPWQC